MKIYNVIQRDRHVDTTAIPFLDLEKAITYAKETALKETEENPNYYEENTWDGWLFFVEYNPEGDCLWITEHEI